MNKEEIIELAEQNKFKLSDIELEQIENKINSILKEYEKLEEVDTEGIKPIFSPLENLVLNRFGKDEVIENLEYKKMYDENKMVDDFYQVPDKEGN